MKKLFILLTALVLLPGLLTAQTTKTAAAPKAQAILAYLEDDTLVQITDAKGNPLVPSEGMVLPLGSVIKTGKTTAEIQLIPNKTIIKLSASTAFKIEALKEADGTGSNDFLLTVGKIRAVAAKLTGTAGAPGYNLRTPTANCGVRGTDFAMEFDSANQKDWVCVQEGLVDFTNILSGATVPVASSQFANTFDAVFQPTPVDASQLAQLFSDLDFIKLNPLDVKGAEIPETAQAAPAAEPAPEPAPEAAPAAEPAADDPVYEFLKKFFGLEVGSITIDGSTYSKAVLSPVIAFDGFKLGLYLPIVYTRDMFDPNDWYRPAGNNEWSFGSDKSDLGSQVSDFATDLALKIKYLEWGTQGVDPYYLKVGNLKTMTLGHGTVVRNFANDQDFPAIRKIGLNAGAKLGGITVEGLADDLAKPSVVGGRLAFDAVGDQVVLGFQGVADLHLANDQDLKSSGRTAASYGDPILIVGGVDLQLFQVDMGAVFRTKAFADLNTLALYNRSASAAYGIEEGLITKTVWHDDSLGSFGGETGFFGNLAFVDYRLSFQAEKGLYRNGLFQGNYYRSRNAILTGVVAYTTDSASAKATDKNLNMGIYGSAGFDLLGLLTMEAAYRYPMTLDASGNLAFDEKGDYLKVRLDIPKDKIPFVKLSGGVSYERTQFVDTLVKGGDLLDAATVLRGEVVYGMVKGMDLVIGLSTAALRDAQGNVTYSGSKPKVGPTISLDTRVSL